MADKEKIGVVGTGRMGQAMVRHLIKHGYAVVAQDIEPKAVEAARSARRGDRQDAGRGRRAMQVRHRRGRLRRRGHRGDARPGRTAGDDGRGRRHRRVVHLHARACEDAGGEGARQRRRGARRADLPRPDGGRHRHHADPVRRQARGVRARQADLQHVRQGLRAAGRHRRRPVRQGDEQFPVVGERHRADRGRPAVARPTAWTSSSSARRC